MNIQIFGTSKCFDTKKAQRYFKERGIKFQMTSRPLHFWTHWWTGRRRTSCLRTSSCF